jgi:hypothetical protein
VRGIQQSASWRSYVFDLWAKQWRGRHAHGDMVIVRFADDVVVGFEHERDAHQFYGDLRGRFAKFGLELADDKTRLVEFGRFAASNRDRRGAGRPETFDFLGFTHRCGTTRNGRFLLKRVTIAKRMRAKLVEIKHGLRRRMHLPIPEQARWLASVVRGHYAYYAVPGNSQALGVFRRQAVWHWIRALRRRSQRTRMTWKRMSRLAAEWLPYARIVHPWPNQRFDARIQGRSPVR